MDMFVCMAIMFFVLCSLSQTCLSLQLKCGGKAICTDWQYCDEKNHDVPRCAYCSKVVCRQPLPPRQCKETCRLVISRSSMTTMTVSASHQHKTGKTGGAHVIANIGVEIFDTVTANGTDDVTSEDHYKWIIIAACSVTMCVITVPISLNICYKKYKRGRCFFQYGSQPDSRIEFYRNTNKREDCYAKKKLMQVQPENKDASSALVILNYKHEQQLRETLV